MSQRPNRRQRRAMGERGNRKFAPADCPECQAFVERGGKGLQEAIAQIALEADITLDTANQAFLNGFHDNDHSEVVSEEFREMDEAPESKAPFN